MHKLRINMKVRLQTCFKLFLLLLFCSACFCLLNFSWSANQNSWNRSLSISAVAFSSTDENKDESNDNDTDRIIQIWAYTEQNDGSFAVDSAGGSVSVNSVDYNSYLQVNLSQHNIVFVSLSTGYNLDGVFEDSDFSVEYSFTTTSGGYEIDIPNSLNTPSELFVKFSIKRINISIESTTEFSVSGAGKYKYGEQVTVTASVIAQKTIFSRWVSVVGDTETTKSKKETYSFPATSDVRLKVVPKYRVDVSGANGGVMLYENGKTASTTFEFEPNTIIKVVALPNSGYEFVRYEGEFSSKQATFEFAVTKPVTIVPIFESKSVLVVFESNDSSHCSFEGSTTVSGVKFHIGDKVLIKVTPADLFKFVRLSTNASGYINASLSEQTYTIVADDVEKSKIYFKAEVEKEYAYTSIVIYGSGTAFINDITTSTGLTQNMLLDSSYQITLKSGDMYELSSIDYKNLSTGTTTSLLDKMVDGSFNIDITDDFELEITFVQILWIDYAVTPQGSGTSSDPYLISSPEEFAFIAYAVNNNITQTDTTKQEYSKAYYLITKNINFEGKFWQKVGVNFYGTLDINFKIIKNLTLTDGTATSNFSHLFEGNLNMKREINTVWRICGVLISLVLATIIVVLMLSMRRTKEPVTKVIILPQDLIKKE